jgi:transcriptional regulator with XRE-family HTH domain
MDQDEHEPAATDAVRTMWAIQERLDDLGWNQFDLVRESNVSATTIRWLQSGVERTYRPGTLAKISKALGWPAGAIRQMLAGEQPPEPVVDPGRPEAPPPAGLEGRLESLEQGFSELRADVARIAAWAESQGAPSSE